MVDLPQMGADLSILQAAPIASRRQSDRIDAKSAEIRIRELGAPYGQGRSTALKDWGKAGLNPGSK